MKLLILSDCADEAHNSVLSNSIQLLTDLEKDWIHSQTEYIFSTNYHGALWVRLEQSCCTVLTNTVNRMIQRFDIQIEITLCVRVQHHGLKPTSFWVKLQTNVQHCIVTCCAAQEVFVHKAGWDFQSASDVLFSFFPPIYSMCMCPMCTEWPWTLEVSVVWWWARCSPCACMHYDRPGLGPDPALSLLMSRCASLEVEIPMVSVGVQECILL